MSRRHDSCPTGGVKPTTAPGAVCRVLVVEDDLSLRALLASVLVDAGYRVLTAEHGRAALDLVDSGFAPDLILLDLWMPVMDGRAFLRAYRQRTAARVPVVVVTAALHADAEVLGVDAVVGKPFDVDDLLATVERYLVPAAFTPA